MQIDHLMKAGYQEHEAREVALREFVLLPEEPPDEDGQGSETQKFNDNLAAITALKAIERENRRATPEEQRQLARYIGWGSLANAFRDTELKPGGAARSKAAVKQASARARC
jgi:hypothetical protein